MRTSIGPSDGGLTCSLALPRLLSIINETRSATPCANSGVSTPAATFIVGGGEAPPAFELADGASKPTVPSGVVADTDASLSALRECLSPAFAAAVADTASTTECATAV